MVNPRKIHIKLNIPEKDLKLPQSGGVKYEKR
jgi:hypothetical protein